MERMEGWRDGGWKDGKMEHGRKERFGTGRNKRMRKEGQG